MKILDVDWPDHSDDDKQEIYSENRHITNIQVFEFKEGIHEVARGMVDLCSHLNKGDEVVMLNDPDYYVYGILRKKKESE